MVYASASASQNHKTSSHGTESGHFCSKYDKTFSWKSCLQRHNRTVHGQREQSYICGYFAQRTDNLASHIRSQHFKIMRDSDDDELPRKRRVTTDIDTPEPSQSPSSPQPGSSQEPQSPLQCPSRAPDPSQRDLIEDEGESNPNFEFCL